MNLFDRLSYWTRSQQMLHQINNPDSRLSAVAIEALAYCLSRHNMELTDAVLKNANICLRQTSNIKIGEFVELYSAYLRDANRPTSSPQEPKSTPSAGRKANVENEKAGYSSSNPLRFTDMFESRKFLARLRSQDGGEVTWERAGSISSSSFPMPVDHYIIFGANGEKTSDLYLYCYGDSNASSPPKGFLLA